MAGSNIGLPEVHPGDDIRATEWNGIVQQLNLMSQMGRGTMNGGSVMASHGRTFTRTKTESDWPILFSNISGQVIPPYGCIQFAGFDSDLNVLKADVSDDYGARYAHFVNGPQSVDVGDAGHCVYPAEIVKVGYDSSDGTPGVGINWGPIAGSFLIRRVGQGFRVLAVDTELEIVVAFREPCTEIVGTTNSGVTIGTSVVVNVRSALGAAIGTEALTGEQITAYSRFAGINSGSWVRCRRNFDADALGQGQWEITNWVCA